MHLEQIANSEKLPVKDKEFLARVPLIVEAYDVTNILRSIKGRNNSDFPLPFHLIIPLPEGSEIYLENLPYFCQQSNPLVFIDKKEKQLLLYSIEGSPYTTERDLFIPETEQSLRTFRLNLLPHFRIRKILVNHPQSNDGKQFNITGISQERNSTYYRFDESQASPYKALVLNYK